MTYDQSGLGDIEAWGLWRLGPEAARSGGSAGGGVGFPSGKDSPPDLTSENIFFGAGAFSLLASIEGFHRAGASVNLFGLARYRRPLGSNDQGYRFGDDFGWSGTVRWQPHRPGRLGLSFAVSGQHLGQDTLAGEDVASRGGRLHHAAAGADIALGKGLSLSLLYQRLVKQDMRGDQLLAPWQAITGLSWSWGEHVHDDDHAQDHGGVEPSSPDSVGPVQDWMPPRTSASRP